VRLSALEKIGALRGTYAAHCATEHSPAATAINWAYASPIETPFLHGIQRARKIRMRLGASFSFAEPFPDKPPRMHRRTYLRMRVSAGKSIALYDQS
jgi:hypothetical protein